MTLESQIIQLRKDTRLSLFLAEEIYLLYISTIFLAED